MASKYIIREKGTSTFCTSSRHRLFSTDLNEAALFAQPANAKKAIRDMFSNPNGVYRCWCTDTKQYFNGDLKAYVEELRERKSVLVDHYEAFVTARIPELEVIEVCLKIVDNKPI